MAPACLTQHNALFCPLLHLHSGEQPDSRQVLPRHVSLITSHLRFLWWKAVGVAVVGCPPEFLSECFVGESLHSTFLDSKYP